MAEATRTERFDIGTSCRLQLRLDQGHIRVLEGPAGQISVEISGPEAERFQTRQRDGEIVVQHEPSFSQLDSGLAETIVAAITSATRPRSAGARSRHDVRVTVPAGAADLTVFLASADLTAEVSLRSLNATTASGDLNARDVHGPVKAKLASGDLQLGSVQGTLSVVSASGDVRTGVVAGAASVTTASGDIEIGTAENTVHAKTASGDVAVGTLRGPALDCKTLSGDVSIGLPPGRLLDVDLQSFAGSVRNAFDGAHEEQPPAAKESEHSESAVRIHVRTMSGDIALRHGKDRARESAAA
jgi:hypothetical protein